MGAFTMHSKGSAKAACGLKILFQIKSKRWTNDQRNKRNGKFKKK
jgi:hypothetical protein